MSLRAIGALLACACAARAPAPAQTSPQAPVTLSVAVLGGEPVPGGRLELRAELARQGAWPYPIAVEWRVPAGARAAGGGLQAVVTDDASGADLAIDLLTVPADDLVVVAESRGPGGGFHAEARYRFGRPDPAPAAGPTRTGPATNVNGHDLGPSVPIDH